MKIFIKTGLIVVAIMLAMLLLTPLADLLLVVTPD